MNKIIKRSCPACGTDNQDNHHIHHQDEWKIKKCTQCRFVYLENSPVYESLIKDFAWEVTSKEEKKFRENREPVKQKISSVIKSFRKKYLRRDKLSKLINKHFAEGNVLDIGCSKGSVLHNLDQKYTPFGIEISEYLAKEGSKLLASRGGFVLHNNAVNGLKEFKENFFKGIIMSAFLEHEIDPLDLLTECYRVLDNNGKAIIKVPNYQSINRKTRGDKWCGFRYPDHVNYFTPSTLKKMCQKAGFSIGQFTFADRHPLSDNMWLVITKKG